MSWEDHETILSIRGESSGVGITYLRGEVELMSPSIDHEGFKKCVARLLEVFAMVMGLELDLERLASFVDPADQTRAAREYMEWLQASRSAGSSRRRSARSRSHETAAAIARIGATPKPARCRAR